MVVYLVMSERERHDILGLWLFFRIMKGERNPEGSFVSPEITTHYGQAEVV
jgi:hypothetical protein